MISVATTAGAAPTPGGYGIPCPPLLALVQAHGVPNAEGGEGAANGWTPARIYAEGAAGHPVMAWTETGWDRPYVGYWTTLAEKIQIRNPLIQPLAAHNAGSTTPTPATDP